jgi:hypothetical protein
MLDDAASALSLSGRLVGLATLLAGVQVLVGMRALAPGGALDVRLTPLLTRLRFDVVVLRVAHRVGASGTTVVRVAAGVQCLAGVQLIVWPSIWPGFCVAFVSGSLLAPYLRLGLDGADDMLRVLTVALALAGAASASPVARTAGVVFVGGMVALAYCVAGLSKAQSVMWWGGRGLRGIVSTEYFGVRGLRRRVPAPLFVLGSWAVIAGESSFPLAIVLPPPLALAVVAAAVRFHVACGLVMGLDAFTFAFAAGLPCVLWCSFAVASTTSPTVRIVSGVAFAVAVLLWMAFWSGRETVRRPAP